MQPLHPTILSSNTGALTCDGIYRALHSASARLEAGCNTGLYQCARRSGRRSMACRARELTEEDLIRIAGSKELVQKALADQEASEIIDIPFEGIPHRPRFAIPNPKRGERFAAYHRETRGIFKNQKSWLKAKPIWQEPIVLKEPINDDPVPWYPAKRQTPPPIISLPEKRPPFVDKKVYQWERKGFIPYFEKLYPYPVVEVEVTITNDPVVADEWALARKTEGVSIYGFDTKFWTYNEKGIYYSDSHPEEWSDLALLQVATQREILLVQPLDMPVEKLGRELRSIFSYKYVKKSGSNVLAKSKGLKMCDFQFHGAHDHFALLKRALDLSSKRMLPLNVEQLDLQGMSMHLLGMDLDVELSTTAHWEKEILDDEMIEVAAKEAWCSWALYGILTRMTREIVILWSKGFPKAKDGIALAKRKELRRAILLSKSTTLEHVREAQILKEARRSLPKLSKMAAAELVLDAGIDLYESVDQDLFHDRLAGLVKDEVTAAEAAEQEQKDESSRGYRRWGQEEVKEESWRQYMEEPESEEEVTRIDEPPQESMDAELMEGDLDSSIDVQESESGDGWEQPAQPVARGHVGSPNTNGTYEEPTRRLPDGHDIAWMDGDSSSMENIFEETLSAVDDFDQVGTLDEEVRSDSSGDESEEDQSFENGNRDSLHSSREVYPGSGGAGYSETPPDMSMRKGWRERTRRTTQRKERVHRDMSTSTGKKPVTYNRWIENYDDDAENSDSRGGDRSATPAKYKKKEDRSEPQDGALDDYDFGAMIDAW